MRLGSGSSRLSGLITLDRILIAWGYDADGQRTHVSITPLGGGSAKMVEGDYQLGYLAYQSATAAGRCWPPSLTTPLARQAVCRWAVT